MSQYTAGISIRDYYRESPRSDRPTEFNDSDRSLRRPLIKRGTVNGAAQTPAFFRFGRSSRHGGRPRDHGPAKKPVGMIPERTLHVASVLRICIWSGLSYTGATFNSSLLPPRALSCFFPFLFLSYRCLSVLFKYVDTPPMAACARSPRSGGCERKGRGRPNSPPE